MYQYFAFNVVFSLLIFLYLYLLKTAPFRIRFRLIMLAIVSWLVPYDVILSLVNQQSFITISSEITEFNGSLKQSFTSNINAETYVSPIQVFMLLTIVGFFMFIKDIISLKLHLKKYSSMSLLFKSVKSVNIYQVKDSDNIFTVGLFNPQVYIGDKYISSKTLPSIIQHELQHINNNDQIWLLIITFIQKTLWWNPIVYSLSQKARNYIELSCDEMCKLCSTDDSYLKDLAQILLKQHKSSSPLTSTFFGKSKLNIYRIKQLTKEFKMKNIHKAIVFITAITPFLLMPLVGTSSESANKKTNHKNGEKIVLNENQVDLEYSITLKVPEKNATVNTRKIESRIVANYGEEIKYGQESDIFSSSKFQPIKPTNFVFAITVDKVDEKSVMVNTVITFNHHGKKVEQKPSIWVENGKEASLFISGISYEIELIVKPIF